MTHSQVRILFYLAAAYDFLIGIAFLCFGIQLFDAAGVPHPNHWAYTNFGALMLMIFGLMFFAVARDPHANRNLIPYGMLLKLSYVSLTCTYWLTTGCPLLFKPFAVIDALMLIGFALAYNVCRAGDGSTTAGSA